jgi:hypothetical protein
MSAMTSAIERLERIGDRCNAIVVKEVRQALKSKQFVGTFALLLLVAWGGSIFMVANAGDSIEYGSSAWEFFVLFFLVQAVASLVIVPFGAFRSIVEERAENTLELVQITALTPRQIVWGKSLSALVQVLVYFSAITPFIAFTSLLPGFDLVQTLFDLGWLLIASFTFCSIALAIGAQTKNKISQAFGSLGVIVLALIGTITFCTFMLSEAVVALPVGESQFWWAITIAAFVALSTSFLCQQIAIAQLTFESDNRSSGIRLTVTVQWVVFWLSMLAYVAVYAGAATFNVFPMVTLTSIFLTVAGLYLICEPEALSRRVARGLPRSRSMRMVWVPFLPGGTRGLIFGLGSIGLMGALAALALAVDSRSTTSHMYSTPKELWAAATVIGYAVIYLGVGALVTRLFRRVLTGFSPGHLIAILLLGNLLLMLVEVLWHFLLGFHDNGFQPIDVVNPIITIGAIFDRTGLAGSELAEVLVAIPAVLALVINIKPMVQAARAVLNNPIRAQIEFEAARRREAQAATQVLAAQTGAAPVPAPALEAGAATS